MQSIRGIVLAAGKSTRFGTHFNKLLTPLCGIPLVAHITDLLQKLHIPTTIVVGHLKEQVTATITERTPDATFVTQEQSLGTGHALLCSTPHWDSDHILVLNGDMPLITNILIEELITTHTTTDAAISFVMAYPDTQQHAYGRVIIEQSQMHIVEAKDFTGDRTIVYPINAGIYLFKKSFLQNYATELQPNNAQKQLYITDLIGIASREKFGCNPLIADYNTVRGVNTLAEFTHATQVMRERIIDHWLNAGVLIEDPATTWIDVSVTIGDGTRIASGVHLRGTTQIGTRCIIEQYSIIEDSTLHDMVTVRSHSVIHTGILTSGTIVGPFAQIHDETVFGPFTHISPADQKTSQLL